MRLDYEMTQGLKIVEVFVDQIESAGDRTERLHASQRKVSVVLREHVSLLRQEAQFVRDLIDPWTRLAKAKDAYRRALRDGDRHAIRTAGRAMMNAQGAADIANGDQPKSVGARAKDFVFRQLLKRTGTEELHTVGLGGEILSGFGKSLMSNPLKSIGSMLGGGAEIAAGAEGGLAIAGMGAAALTPVGIAALAVVEGFDKVAEAAKKVWEAAIEAASHLNSIGVGRFLSGGDSHQQAQLSGIAAALGMSPEEMGGVARQFGEGMTSTPEGRIAASQAGIDPIGGRYGSHNHAKRLLEAFEYVRSRSEEDAQRWVYSAQLPPEIAGQVRMWSPDTWKRMKGTGTAYSAGDERLGADFLAELEIFKGHVKEIGMAFKTKALPPLTAGLKILNNVMAWIADKAKWLADHLHQIPYIGTLFPRLLPDEKKQETAVQRNTAAIDRLTDTLEDGIYGDAAAAASKALPGGMERWMTIDKHAYSSRLLVGGIAL